MKNFTALTALLIVCVGAPAVAQMESNTQPAAPTTAPPAPATPANRPDLLVARPADLSSYHKSALNIDLGWGGPYGGLGVSYAYLVGPSTDINAGVGIGFGGKIGIGVRQYLSPARRLSPYLGINVSRSGRIGDMNLTLNEDQPNEEKATVRLEPSALLHLRSGLRWQPGRVGLVGTLGYGVRLSNDPASYTYVNGQQPSKQMRTIVNILSPGGLEISIGMSIGLGRR